MEMSLFEKQVCRIPGMQKDLDAASQAKSLSSLLQGQSLCKTKNPQKAKTNNPMYF